MGTDHPDTTPVAAAVLSMEPSEVRVEEASDGDHEVYVSGTMYHNGLNANAWGLTESGAKAIADDLAGRDYTAAHPPLRGARYDRSISAGQGAPIGTVLHTDVVAVDSATLAGGQYTATYEAKVLDPDFAQKLDSGLYTADGYGVSIGIYAEPENAECSVCHAQMASDSCEHSRGETVRVEADGETREEIAGPLYPDGEADHLAHVWIPAYDGATAEVSATTEAEAELADHSLASAHAVPEAASVLAEPFDAPTPVPADASADSTSPAATPDPAPDGYPVRLADPESAAAERGAYHVTLNHE